MSNWLWSGVVNNPTAFTKAQNEWTQIELNIGAVVERPNHHCGDDLVDDSKLSKTKREGWNCKTQSWRTNQNAGVEIDRQENDRGGHRSLQYGKHGRTTIACNAWWLIIRTPYIRQTHSMFFSRSVLWRFRQLPWALSVVIGHCRPSQKWAALITLC